MAHLKGTHIAEKRKAPPDDSGGAFRENVVTLMGAGLTLNCQERQHPEVEPVLAPDGSGPEQ